MTKPDDIPLDVWNIATKVFFEAMDQPADDWTMSSRVIAKAIMADREGRLIEKLPILAINEPQDNESDLGGLK